MKRGYDQIIPAPPNLRAVVVLEEEDGTTLEVALPIVAIAFSSDQPTAFGATER
jgi:hypothetical protein